MSSNVGEKLKMYRERANLSQLQIEMAIGKSTGSLSRMESGKVNPLKETLFKIARVLKLSDDEVLVLIGYKEG